MFPFHRQENSILIEKKKKVGGRTRKDDDVLIWYYDIPPLTPYIHFLHHDAPAPPPHIIIIYTGTDDRMTNCQSGGAYDGTKHKRLVCNMPDVNEFVREREMPFFNLKKFE